MSTTVPGTQLTLNKCSKLFTGKIPHGKINWENTGLKINRFLHEKTSQNNNIINNNGMDLKG